MPIFLYVFTTIFMYFGIKMICGQDIIFSWLICKRFIAKIALSSSKTKIVWLSFKRSQTTDTEYISEEAINSTQCSIIIEIASIVALKRFFEELPGGPKNLLTLLKYATKLVKSAHCVVLTDYSPRNIHIFGNTSRKNHSQFCTIIKTLM